jgi:2,3-bisphosphoglycerate-independent phosphoglycerate mutase
MRQLVRSLCISGGTTGAKPVVDAVCLTEYDHAFNLPAAFRQEPEKNTLIQVLSGSEIPNIKITESSRLMHMTRFFDGGNEFQQQFEQQIVVTDAASFNSDIPPESQSFRITDTFRRGLEASANRVFVVDFPAADMMADTGDLTKTVEAIQYIDTCLGGICEKTREMGGVVMITATHGNCEEMVHDESGEPNPLPTANPVPFHYVDYDDRTVRLQDGRSLEDIAPTILGILEIEKPEEMTGMDIRCV